MRIHSDFLLGYYKECFLLVDLDTVVVAVVGQHEFHMEVVEAVENLVEAGDVGEVEFDYSIGYE